MTREEAKDILYGMKADNLNLDDLRAKDKYNALTMAIKALEQEPCNKYIKEIDHLRKYISKLETQIVEQEPKTGLWEWNQYDYNPNLGNWHCSECGSIAIECVPKKDPSGVPLYKYCPQCGCRLVGPQESEDKG